MARKAVPAIILILAAIIALLTIHPMPASAGVHTDTLPACTTEDGSGQALCVWDAQRQGNGVGTDVMAGDCSLGTVGDEYASAACMRLWVQPMVYTHMADGSMSITHNGKALIEECMSEEWLAREGEMNGDYSIRNTLIENGWTLGECFNAMLI